MKKHVFAWDEEEVKLPEIREEAPEIKDNVVSFEDALIKIKEEESKILENAREVISSEEIKKARPLSGSNLGHIPSEYEKAVKKNELDQESPSNSYVSGHIVLLVHSFYKEAGEATGIQREKVDTVYEWYIKTIRESMVEEENLMKITLTGLGGFQISIRCILGTLYKRMAYSEKMFDGILEQNHRNIQFKRRALERVLVPTNIAYRKGKNKFDLLGHFPEFNNRVFKKTEEFFYIIATKLPKLYERLSRVR